MGDAERVLRQVLLGVALLAVAACESGKPDDPVAAPSVASMATVTTAQPVHELWAYSCALCHVDGNAGAPRMGNAQEWLPRLAKGADVLLQHTIEGFNQMPPLGYCMACERDDFIALIDFMTRGIDRKGDAAIHTQQPEAAQ